MNQLTYVNYLYWRNRIRRVLVLSLRFLLGRFFGELLLAYKCKTCEKLIYWGQDCETCYRKSFPIRWNNGLL